MLTRWGMPLALLLTLAIAMSSCATSDTAKALVVSGQSLASAGNTFAETGAVMNDLLDKKIITADQYRPWKTWGERFQVTFPRLKKLWEDARTAYDAAVAKKDATATALAAEKQAALDEAIKGLLSDLAMFASRSYELLRGPTASPPAASKAPSWLPSWFFRGASPDTSPPLAPAFG